MRLFHPKHVELFAGNKNTVQKVSSCWNILALTHDARIHEHKIPKTTRAVALVNGHGALVEGYLQETTQAFGEKPLPVPLCPPHTSRELSQEGTRTSAVTTCSIQLAHFLRKSGITIAVVLQLIQ
jgi:hypothetical protein